MGQGRGLDAYDSPRHQRGRFDPAGLRAMLTLTDAGVDQDRAIEIATGAMLAGLDPEQAARDWLTMQDRTG